MKVLWEKFTTEYNGARLVIRQKLLAVTILYTCIVPGDFHHTLW